MRLLAFNPKSEVVHGSQHGPGLIAKGAHIHGGKCV